MEISAMALGSPRSPEVRPALPPQTRIRMTALGAARCPNLAGREGVVIGTGRYRSTVRVMLRRLQVGNLAAQHLHRTCGREGRRLQPGPPLA